MGRSAEGRAPPGAAERLWELSSDLMAVTDIDGGVLAVNSAWWTLLGWTEADLVGGLDLLHPDDVEAVAAEKARVQAGATTMRFESRLRARDGGYRRFSWRAFADAGRMYVVGRDITEQMRREEAARHAAHRSGLDREGLLELLRRTRAPGQVTPSRYLAVARQVAQVEAQLLGG